ncbi:MAG: hypothetical protein K8T91_25515 [Planctomycetes bacterium]|nr:hypothetical protein [Planctomycetota bacterium]
MTLVPSCSGKPAANHTATVDVDFNRVTKIVEQKLQLLAPESRPLSGGYNLHYYSDRKESRKIEPNQFAEYGVSAMAQLGGRGSKQPVRCGVTLKKLADGVEIHCEGAAWDVQTYNAETYWSPERFLEEVLEELPWNQPIQWGDPSRGLRMGVVIRPHSEYPKVRVYVQNVSSTQLEVCPAISSLLAKRIDVGDTPVRTRSFYVTDTEYVATDGRRFDAVVTGAFMASGLGYHSRANLAPNEILLWARDDLRLGDVETNDKKVMNDALPVGTYRLSISLATSKEYPGIPNNRPGIWDGSIQCLSEPFAFSK